MFDLIVVMLLLLFVCLFFFLVCTFPCPLIRELEGRELYGILTYSRDFSHFALPFSGGRFSKDNCNSLHKRRRKEGSDQHVTSTGR